MDKTINLRTSRWALGNSDQHFIDQLVNQLIEEIIVAYFIMRPVGLGLLSGE